MRGLGKKQARVAFENRQKILRSIKKKNKIFRTYCTMGDLYRDLRINKQSLRNHIKTLLESELIHEERVHNNARGFVEQAIWIKMKSNFMIKIGYSLRTDEEIYFLKFKKPKYSI